MTKWFLARYALNSTLRLGNLLMTGCTRVTTGLLGRGGNTISPNSRVPESTAQVPSSAWGNFARQGISSGFRGSLVCSLGFKGFGSRVLVQGKMQAE